jgi:hypothetical protein
MLRDTYDRLGFRALEARDQRRSIFVKVETRMEYIYWLIDFIVSDELVRRGFPRSIISSTPERLVRTGPFFHALGERMQRVWNATSSILYGACSSETFAAWFCHWRAIFGPDVWFIMIDFVRMDAHYHHLAVQSELKHWKKFGLSGASLAAELGGRKFKGITRSGLAVSVAYRRASGDAKTSAGNTQHNARVSLYALADQAELGSDVAMPLNGDDNSAISRLRIDPERVRSRALRLGCPITCVVSQNLWDYEFCSKLMYPSADGLMPAPKLGRFLTKVGWMLDKPTLDYRSVVSVYLTDMWHVPFAREYLQHVLNLLPVTPRRRVILDDDHKMHAGRRHEQSPEIWAFLYNRYGLTRADHASFVSDLATITQLPAVVRAPWAFAILERDS